MTTKIEQTDKGYVARVQYEDNVRINSSAFPDKLDAQEWLLLFLRSQEGHIYVEKAA